MISELQKTTALKNKPKDSDLKFGNIFTDYMYVMDYVPEKGWLPGKIVPYAEFATTPAASVFHYGQTVFEGLKAFKTNKDETQIFRLDKHAARFDKSCEALCIPKLPHGIFENAVKELIALEKDWVPKTPGCSLYIRPFTIALDPFLGLKSSDYYKFMIILSPVGAYYAEGFNPVKIIIEEKYVRAVKGGLGFAKTAANYAASLKASVEAKKKGFTQVLWLDGIEHKYIEEVGSMNIFFVIGEELVTPPLEGTILDGVTRDSVLQFSKKIGNELGIKKVSERKISVEDVLSAHEKGLLKEVFGSGTAAVISPVGLIQHREKNYVINNQKVGPIAKKLFDEIMGVQYSQKADVFNWMTKV